MLMKCLWKLALKQLVTEFSLQLLISCAIIDSQIHQAWELCSKDTWKGLVIFVGVGTMTYDFEYRILEPNIFSRDTALSFEIWERTWRPHSIFNHFLTPSGPLPLSSSTFRNSHSVQFEICIWRFEYTSWGGGDHKLTSIIWLIVFEIRLSPVNSNMLKWTWWGVIVKWLDLRDEWFVCSVDSLGCKYYWSSEEL
jgi:hypothetical protein